MKIHELYSVKITDEKNKRTGTGVLFYENGSEVFYVFTCAHVIYTSDEVSIRIPILLQDGKLEEINAVADKSRFHFSPLDEPNIIQNESTHTCDIAVIECDKKDLPIIPTHYAVCLMASGERIKAVGYPLGDGGNLYYSQSDLKGEVLRIMEDANDYIVFIDGGRINAADREADLKGYSGSPIWNADKLNENICLMGGLIATGCGINANGGRVKAMQSRLLQSLMRDDFGVTIESRFTGASENEIAPGYLGSEDSADRRAVRASWLENEVRKARTYIATLQLKKATNTAKKAIDNAEFNECSVEQKYSVYAAYLDAFRLARDYEIYDRIVEEMHDHGIRSKKEYLQNAMRCYEANELDDALSYVSEALKYEEGGSETKILSLAIKAEMDEKTDVSLLSEVLGENDELLIKPKNQSEEVAIYQMLGYILGNRFKETGHAIRCLNRAYQLGGDPYVLETLGITYYFHSLRDAFVDENKDIVDPLRINQGDIEKAREALLQVFSAADEMWLRGMFRRAGLQIFKCFFFLHDNFRIYKHYHDVIKYYEFSDSKSKRDVQVCYLDVAMQKEAVELESFDALTDEDRSYYELIQILEEPMRQFDGGITIKGEMTESSFLEILNEAEKRIHNLKAQENDECRWHDRLHGIMINLYGNGILRYHWDAITKVKRHMDEINDPLGKEIFSLYLRELQHEDLQTIEKEYCEFFERHSSVISFEEWIHFYVRHGMIDKVKKLYDRVFDDYGFLMAEQPEYFYRAYIDFILQNQLDLTAAIRCFVERKVEFKDIFIYMAFEMDLNFATTTFNNPDEMLENVKILYDESLITKVDYDNRCLTINMLNCRPEMAEEYATWAKGMDPRKGTPAEANLFVWKGARVQENPQWESMKYKSVEDLIKIYDKEEWHRDPNEILNECNTEHKRIIVVDLWTLYLMTKGQINGWLLVFDTVYVTHSTISMALHEILNVNDDIVRRILGFLQKLRNIIFLSPTLEQQLKVRSPEYPFMEVHSACLLAKEFKCPALIGEFRYPIPKELQANVIRPNEVETVLNCAGKNKPIFTIA